MPVKAIRRITAMPAPITIPNRRWRPCRPRQAIAITNALSPDNRTLIQMILPTASQNDGLCRSAWNWAAKAPRLAGPTACNNQSTTPPPTSSIAENQSPISLQTRSACKHQVDSPPDARSGKVRRGFPKRSCSIKDLKRDDDSTQSHRALGRRSEPIPAGLSARSGKKQTLEQELQGYCVS